MVNLHHLIHLQLEIFILMLIGYIISKNGIINSERRKGLTDLVINLILPANIIRSFMMDLDITVIISSGLIFVVSLILQIFCHVFFFYLFPNVNERQRSVLNYATLCSNAGFMGNPVVQEIYGDQGLLLASIFLIPQRIVMWSAGVKCFTNEKGKNAIKKVITHPCIIAVFIGMFLMISQIQLPEFATKTIDVLSQCTTALSMIVIGGILSEISIKSVVSKLSLYYCFIRLLLIPILVLLACIIFKIPYLVTAVSVVLAGMPAGTTTAILAEKYNGDSKLAVRLVFISTLLSLITIPVLCMIVNGLL